MADLPYVVLRLILGHVKSTSSGTRQNDLLACSLVNRAWHHAATPCLYGIVALDIPRLAVFMHSAGVTRYAQRILSLTLRMEGDDALSRRPDGEQVPHPTLCERLRDLIPLLGQMTNLATFSFFTPRMPICFVPRREIIDLLGALPASCTSLELDTQAKDRRDKDTEPQETTHVCDAIRRVLPQMQYVRLRMAAMCSSMFEYIDGEDTDTSISIPLPKLRAMIVNCSPSIARCGPNDWFGSRAYQPSDLAWHPVTKALERVVESGLGPAQRVDGRRESWLKNPEDVTIRVTETTSHSNQDALIWQAKIRADMIRKESWAMPTRSVWIESSIPGSWHIRTPGGGEWMGTSEITERLAEGEDATWFSLRGGARLPTGIILAKSGDDISSRDATSAITEMSGGWAGVQPDPTPVKTVDAWKQANPRKMTYVWINEAKVGAKLVGAERRVGHQHYLSLDPVIESTPDGWRRVAGGLQNEILEQIES